MTFPIFDSHCHLDAADFEPDRAEVIARARAAGVTAAIVPATDLPSSEKTVALVAATTEIETYGAVGIHPHEAKAFDDAAMAELEALSREARVIAIGETGLDFHYNFSPPEVQQSSLRAHIRLALRRGLPMILHCRNAEEALLQILDQENASACGGVVHCYTGSMDTAERLLDRGFYLGFTGIVTFKNAAALREVVRRVPPSRILLETDSPYLAPIPYRGKRNEPSFLPHVAETVGTLHGKSAADMAYLAIENTRRCFHLD